MKTTGKINELPADYPWHLVDDGSAIEDIEDPNSFVKAFPNPTSRILNIQLQNSEQTFQTVRLLSYSGQQIDIEKPDLNNGSVQIDLSGLISGMYFVQVSFSDKTELVKVMKK